MIFLFQRETAKIKGGIKMKKNIMLALTAALILSVAGCSDSKSGNSGSVSTPASTSSSSSSTTSSVDEGTPTPDTDVPEESKEFAGLAGFETAANNSSLIAGGSFCDAGEGFYYADDTGIYHITDEKTKLIYEGKAYAMSMHNNRLYFLQEAGNVCVYSGEQVNTVVKCSAKTAAASSTGIYYIDGNDRLHRSDGIDEVSVENKVNSLNIAGSYVIYTEAETSRLCAYDAANGSVITIAKNGTAPVVSGDKVYYVNENGGIDSISLVDGSKTSAAEACSGNIAVQDSAVYYINGTKICALSDGELTELYTAADEAAELSALSVCDGTIYFTENGKVMKLSDNTATEFTVAVTE